MRFNFKIKYKLKNNNLTNKLLKWLNYIKGFKTGDRKQIINILLFIL